MLQPNPHRASKGIVPTAGIAGTAKMKNLLKVVDLKAALEERCS
jgi:hypothetical protein